MAITVNPATYVIYIPQSDLTPVSGLLYELSVDQFRLALIDWEDSEDGMWMPRTHNHSTAVVLSGVTYTRSVEIRYPYTVEFEDGQYVVGCVGANHNLADVKVANQVSLIIGNAAGLQVVETGTSGLTQGETDQLGLIYAFLVGRQELAAGSVANFNIYDPGTGTLLKVQDITDKDGKAVTLQAGVPARRSVARDP